MKSKRVSRMVFVRDGAVVVCGGMSFGLLMEEAVDRVWWGGWTHGRHVMEGRFIDVFAYFTLCSKSLVRTENDCYNNELDNFN